LLEGEPVAQVATNVGLHDRAHLTFTRHFKRHVGHDARELRVLEALVIRSRGDLGPGNSRLPGDLDQVPVGVEALEPDIALGLLILRELDAVGDQARSEPTDLAGRMHLEPEVREPRTSLPPSAGPRASAKPSGS
jgi:hypothetical protein